MSLSEFMNQFQHRVEQNLLLHLQNAEIPEELKQAMQYSTLGGGKRIRALLVYATGIAIKANSIYLDAIACAVELIHAYSLIHDDLPSMDNADLRRGKASCHKAFNEATAILAGDALQSLAFEILSLENSEISATQQLAIINSLAKAIGPTGMVGGQILDIAAENKTITLTELETIHLHKTGALITACIQMAAIAGNCQINVINQLTEFAKSIGLAFQIHDDILDVTRSTSELGKAQGADKQQNKSTYITILGLTKAQEIAVQIYQQSLQFLQDLPFDTDLLKALATFIIERTK